MLFYMDTRTFLRFYLENEEDWRILDTYYVIVSHRIKTHQNNKNKLIIDGSQLCANSATIYQDVPKEAREQYWHQLSEYKAFFAMEVYESIKKGYNIVFLGSRSEVVLNPFFKWMARYIEREFMYPVYEYKAFAKGKTPIYDYDEEEILHYCKKILLEEQKRREEKENKPSTKRHKMVDWSKKKMQKELEEYGLYVTGNETKSELAEMLRQVL